MHSRDEIAQVAQSHVPGEELDAMVHGITAYHGSIRASNAAWALELLGQIPRAEPGSRGADVVGAEADGGRMRLPELRALTHRLVPWWT